MKTPISAAELVHRLPLASIQKVTFYKRDELTTDLICCDVEMNGQSWSFHEEEGGWDDLIRHLEQLPGLRTEWCTKVVQPSFALSPFVAYVRGKIEGSEAS